MAKITKNFRYLLEMDQEDICILSSAIISFREALKSGTHKFGSQYKFEYSQRLDSLEEEIMTIRKDLPDGS